MHLVKLCVGCPTVETLEAWVAGRVADGVPLVHVTRNMPKQAADILDGGSLYWIIKGHIRARQRILALEAVTTEQGKAGCGIHLDPKVVRTVPKPHYIMQGWRYLADDAIAADLAVGYVDETDQMPTAMQRELRALGLL